MIQLIKNSKADFIQGTTAIGVGTTAIGFCTGGRDEALLRTQQGKVGIRAKEHCRGQWMENYPEEIAGVKGDLA